MWVYAILPSGTQETNWIATVGAVNSVLTLLVAALVFTFTWWMFRKTKKLNTGLVGLALILVGAYFAIYVGVSVWVPIYLAFLPLTDFWMVTLLILGISVCLRKTMPAESV
jgi:hypothetical protein